MEILQYKGGLSLIIPKDLIQTELDNFLSFVPDEFQQYKIKRDGVDHYHLTIISSKEKSKKYKISSYVNKCEETLLILGLGKSINDAYYLICHFPIGDKIRSDLNLVPKDFHITLGFNKADDHINRKNIKTIIEPSIINLSKLLENKSENKLKWNEMLWDLIHHNVMVNKINIPLCDLWYRYLTNCANLQKFEQIDIYLPTLIDLNPYLGYYIKLKLKFINHELSKEDLSETYELLKYIKIDHKYYTLVSKLIDIMNHNKINLNSKKRYYIDNISNKICECHSPRNLTKIFIPKKYQNIKGTELYASAMVTNNSEIYIREMGFDLVLNLVENNTSFHKDIPDISFHFPIVDRTPPTIEEAFAIVNIIDKKNKALVHCVGGKGRTNTVIILYLMWKYRMPSYEAMEIIKDRNIIMSESQHEFIKQFERELIKLDECPKFDFPDDYDVIMLIGLPCSGKSTFSKHLSEKCSNIIHLNQDELGRGKYNDLLSQQIKNNQQNIILLDRCHITKDERKSIIDMIKKGNKHIKILGLWFDISIDELMLRSKNRKNHPVLSMKKVPLVIEEKNKLFQEPTMSENFQRLIHIKDEEELNNLLLEWKLPIINLYEDGFYKFPRTRHLHSLGSAERNDLLMTNNEVTRFLNSYVYVEEKIDGANMGISIDGSDYSLKFQNRSHYVNASSHPQFCKLNKWADAFGTHLHSILEPDKHILFGEWMYLKHTVPYDNLPSYFVAFDLYDKTINKFYARPQLEKLLAGTGIPLVPLIYEGEVKDIKQLLEHIHKKSAYGDTNIEGLYCKTPDKDKKYYINRGKIVRENFIRNDSKHWTHNTEPNILSLQSYV